MMTPDPVDIDLHRHLTAEAEAEAASAALDADTDDWIANARGDAPGYGDVRRRVGWTAKTFGGAS